MTEKTVYQSEHNSFIYLPASDYAFNEAQHEAAQHSMETIGNWGRSRYIGKLDVPLHDHDDWEGCVECAAVPAWTFEIYEGTYRD